MAGRLNVIGISGHRRENGHVKVSIVVRVISVLAIGVLRRFVEKIIGEGFRDGVLQTIRVSVNIYKTGSKVLYRISGAIIKKTGQGISGTENDIGLHVLTSGLADFMVLVV